MDAARKTGKPAVSPAPAVASDRASRITVGADAEGQRLDNFLLRLAKGVPKSHVYRIVRSGEVRVNRGRAAADTRLKAGDVVRVPPLRTAAPGAVHAAPAAPLLPPILYEDEHLLVIDKPAGIAAHGGSGVSHGIIERVRAGRPTHDFLELAHRLDRETSGILLLAKSRRALNGLHEQLRDGAVDKRYRLLVAGDWVNDRQHVRAALTKYVNAAGERRVSVDPAGQAAHTVFTLLQRYGACSLLEAQLKTGRTHQIRVHVAHLGYPIVGDDKYGDFELNRRVARGEWGARLPRMFLHAGAIRLAHPVTGAPLAFEAPLPEDCARLLQALARAHAAAV